MTPLLTDGPPKAALTVALAHGAGAPMDSPFMSWFAAALAREGLRVVRFEFPYMRERRESGKKRPPNPSPVLVESWHATIGELGADRLVIGGKSLGGRIASMVADDAGVRGLVCLGYPFHPPGRPDRLRIEHLQRLATPALICQGERDPFGRREEVLGYPLASGLRICWLADGDHGFKPRKASGRTEEGNREEALQAILAFTRELRA
jgi:predicted alpha/beta-hydrolase family hydrolase